jgi:hypothetical protein
VFFRVVVWQSSAQNVTFWPNTIRIEENGKALQGSWLNPVLLTKQNMVNAV